MLVTQWPKPGRKPKSKGGFPQRVKDAVDREFDGQCLLCGHPRDTHHHAYARKMGGSPSRIVDQWWNAVPICNLCHVPIVEQCQPIKEILREWADARREKGEPDGILPDRALLWRTWHEYRQKHPTG